MKTRLLLTLTVLCPAVFPLLAASPAPPATPATLEAYAAVGASLVQDNRLTLLGWTDAQIEAFLRGVRAGFRGEAGPVDPSAQGLFNEIGRRMQELEQAEQQQRFSTEAFAQPGRLAAYLKEMRKQFALEATDSGLCYAIKSGGYGAKPGPDDTIIISCKVNKADASTELPQLAKDKFKIKVADLPPGLAEGFQMMAVGSIALMVLPPDLSYGAGDWPAGTDRGTPLLFTVKLHEIIAAP
jgi:FKBP-type peptidyl-prolyl cis-trans isomerase